MVGSWTCVTLDSSWRVRDDVEWIAIVPDYYILVASHSLTGLTHITDAKDAIS